MHSVWVGVVFCHQLPCRDDNGLVAKHIGEDNVYCLL